MSVTKDLTSATQQATAQTLPGDMCVVVLWATHCPAMGIPAKVLGAKRMTKSLAIADTPFLYTYIQFLQN